MIRKLRLKLILVIMLVAALLLGVVFGLFYTMTKQNLRTQSVSMMQAIAADPIEPNVPGSAPGQVRLPYFVIQIDRSGGMTVIDAGDFDLSDRAFLTRVVEAAFARTEAVGEIPEYNLRYCRVTASSGQSVIFADTSSERQTLRSMVRSALILGLAALAAIFGLSLLVSHWAVQPVDAAWKQQKQFVADASHELKTPLTIILTNTELLQSPDFDEAHRQRLTGGVREAAQQMRALVESLLELARAENGQKAAPFAPVDFSAVAENEALFFEAAFFERGLTLKTDVMPALVVNGDAQKLRQAVAVLLDNAQKYAAGGEVCLTLARAGRGRCRLTVQNEGTPLTPAECRAVFERFYRADSARTRTGSFGLGLPIAQAIVRAHQGKIWAQPYSEGNQFCIELPLLHEKRQETGRSAI